MTFWDFLYQAGLWQWIGLLLLIAAFAQGFSRAQLLTLNFNRRTVHKRAARDRERRPRSPFTPKNT